MNKMTLIQAIGYRNHSRIDELIAEGPQHPLHVIEHCIEMRGDAIDTLMMHVPRACPINERTVRKVIRHLEAIDRYPHAVEVLEAWIRLVPEPPTQPSMKNLG